MKWKSRGMSFKPRFSKRFSRGGPQPHSGRCEPRATRPCRRFSAEMPAGTPAWQAGGSLHEVRGCGCAAPWGIRAWLRAGFPAGLDALESASAGRIARPTFGTAVSLEFGEFGSREAKGGVQFDLAVELDLSADPGLP